jgi:hypothetical protein
MYNTRAPSLLVPFMHYRDLGRLVPLLVGPGARYKGARPNGTLQLYKGTYSIWGGGRRVCVKGAKKGAIRPGTL